MTEDGNELTERDPSSFNFDREKGTTFGDRVFIIFFIKHTIFITSHYNGLAIKALIFG